MRGDPKNAVNLSMLMEPDASFSHVAKSNPKYNNMMVPGNGSHYGLKPALRAGNTAP